MIHFSVKIGLNLFFLFNVVFFSGNDLPKKQMNASINTLTIIVGMNFH